MWNYKMIKTSILIFLLISNFLKSQVIYDLIEPINLPQDDTVSILLSDLFFAEDYSVELKTNEHFSFNYDANTLQLLLIPNKDFSGITLLEFRYFDEDYAIPIQKFRSNRYLFTYKASPDDKQINLFGQFNSWDRKNLPMKDLNGDGIYEIEIPLDPGRYEYKFYVDGKELIDPQNPVKVPNGLGDFNSVRVVEESESEKIFLHVLGYKKKENYYLLKFYFEHNDKSFKLSKQNVIALLDNQEFSEKNFSINGNEVTLKVNSELSGHRFIRLAINKNGKASNIQTVQLIDGNFAGNTEFKTHQDKIIYSLLIDRFSNGDKSNDNPVQHDSLFTPANYQGGDIQGIKNKIQDGYFNRLGINTIWISPIVDNTNNAYREYPAPHRWYTGYHGYWPVSTTAVEEHFGDMNLVRELINKANKKGIKILLDFVSNHIHEENPLWKKHRNWFGVLELPDGRKNLRLWDEYRLTTWFEPYMPSFDYSGSYEALEYMTDNAVWWLKVTGADGFRHDAVKHVPNEFWRLLNRKIKRNIEIPKKKKVYQIGETFGGIDLIASYVNNGQLNAQFNFNLYDVAIPTFLNQDASFKLLDFQMKKCFQVFGYNNLMGNLMDSHDKIRYMAYADGDLEINDGRANHVAWENPPVVDNPSSYDKLKLYLAYLISIPGIPIIYYGDEIGMTGAADPDNRRMMRFDDELNSYEKQNFESVSKLIHIRNNHSALRYGDFLTLQADENLYSFIRSDINERILVILNKNEAVQNVNLKIPSVYKITEAINLFSNSVHKIIDNTFETKINGTSFLILKLK
jgi:glycosidase